MATAGADKPQDWPTPPEREPVFVPEWPPSVDAQAQREREFQPGIVVRNTFIDVCPLEEESDGDAEGSCASPARRNVSAPPSPTRSRANVWENSETGPQFDSDVEELEEDPGAIPTYQWDEGGLMATAQAVEQPPQDPAWPGSQLPTWLQKPPAPPEQPQQKKQGARKGRAKGSSSGEVNARPALGEFLKGGAGGAPPWGYPQPPPVYPDVAGVYPDVAGGHGAGGFGLDRTGGGFRPPHSLVHPWDYEQDLWQDPLPEDQSPPPGYGGFGGAPVGQDRCPPPGYEGFGTEAARLDPQGHVYQEDLGPPGYGHHGGFDGVPGCQDRGPPGYNHHGGFDSQAQAWDLQMPPPYHPRQPPSQHEKLDQHHGAAYISDNPPPRDPLGGHIPTEAPAYILGSPGSTTTSAPVLASQPLPPQQALDASRRYPGSGVPPPPPVLGHSVAGYPEMRGVYGAVGDHYGSQSGIPPPYHAGHGAGAGGPGVDSRYDPVGPGLPDFPASGRPSLRDTGGSSYPGLGGHGGSHNDRSRGSYPGFCGSAAAGSHHEGRCGGSGGGAGGHYPMGRGIAGGAGAVGPIVASERQARYSGQGAQGGHGGHGGQGGARGGGARNVGGSSLAVGSSVGSGQGQGSGPWVAPGAIQNMPWLSPSASEAAAAEAGGANDGNGRGTQGRGRSGKGSGGGPIVPTAVDAGGQKGEAKGQGRVPLSGGGPKRTDYIKKYGTGGGGGGCGNGGGSSNEAEAQGAVPITTMMLKNIPCRKSQEEVMLHIDQKGFGSRYDFFYLPRDVKFRANLGYAFINFLTPEDASGFMAEMNGYRFSGSGSTKACAVVPAHVQGLMNNLAAFKRTEVMRSSRKPYFSSVVTL